MFKLGQIPITVPHLLADVVELELCFGPNSELSKSDIEAIIIGSPNVEIEVGSIDRGEPVVATAEANDRRLRWIDDCFLNLRFRVEVFGKSYPFRIEGGRLIKACALTDERLLYVFLLVCSRLISFPNGTRQRFAERFEEVSRQALRMMMPPGAIARRFGAGSDDRREHFGSDLRSALRKLAEDLKEPVDEQSIEEESSSGDKGLDLVGFLDFREPGRGTLSFFGQCAAQMKGWPKKTLEAHSERYRSFFKFLANPVNVTFIPVCYRQANGAWVQASSVSGTLLIDRLRFCRLIDGKSVARTISQEFSDKNVRPDFEVIP